jgi:peptidoglycan/LPS O-acetylase OafA/YrhL
MKFLYRPEIDGLRAVAVVSVILYHAQITIFGYQIFKGGFIGVDIFFVISGYLITSIILIELFKTGSFSFKYFYERRIRRILPALLFIMLVSFLYAWIFLLPISFINFSKSIIYSIGFSSNFFFHYSGQKYGSEDALLIPFLHTWSLSVEEQYYILFPIILLITFKYFRKYLFIGLIICLIISLLMANWGSRNYASATFYFLHTRIWELLTGSAIAYFEITKGHRSKNKIFNLILPTIGLLLIGYSIFFFNDKIFHPSFKTLSPVLGTCLIIYFSHKHEITMKILSTRLFVGIGLISYSLYLWHYPIFAFARVTQLHQDLGGYKELFLAFTIIFFSIISYFFIERPARNKKYKFKNIFIIIIILITFFLIFNFNIIANKGYKNRFPEFINSSLVDPSDLMTKEAGKIIENSNLFLFQNKIKNLVVVGDSLAGHLAYYTYKSSKDRYNFISSTYGACPYILNLNVVDKKGAIIGECNSITQQIRRNFINEKKNSIVILYSVSPYNLIKERFRNPEIDTYVGSNMLDVSNDEKTLLTFNDKEKFLTDNYFKTVNDLLENGHSVILVYPFPEIGVQLKDYAYYNFLKNKKFFYSIKYSYFLERNIETYKLLDSIQHERIYRVYPHKLVCNTFIIDRCATHSEDLLFYRDNFHPSLYMTKQIVNEIMKEIEKIEIKLNK